MTEGLRGGTAQVEDAELLPCVSAPHPSRSRPPDEERERTDNTLHPHCGKPAEDRPPSASLVAARLPRPPRSGYLQCRNRYGRTALRQGSPQAALTIELESPWI